MAERSETYLRKIFRACFAIVLSMVAANMILIPTLFSITFTKSFPQIITASIAIAGFIFAAIAGVYCFRKAYDYFEVLFDKEKKRA
jgi:hypothetical protein